MRDNVAEGFVFHLLDIGSGGKSLLRAGQDNGPDLRIRLALIQNLVQLGDELSAERIERLGAVERDEPHPAPLFEKHSLKGHGDSFHSLAWQRGQ